MPHTSSVSEFFFGHWLVREHITGKSIMKVTRYTLSNSRLRYNFATENELPSRFDIAKHKYGGPFMAQQVDNVHMGVASPGIFWNCVSLQ